MVAKHYLSRIYTSRPTQINLSQNLHLSLRQSHTRPSCSQPQNTGRRRQNIIPQGIIIIILKGGLSQVLAGVVMMIGKSIILRLMIIINI